MHLIIGFALIAIIVIRIIGEKLSFAPYEQDRNTREKEVSSMMSQYTDEDLEKKLKERISNFLYFDEIWAEISGYLATSGYWGEMEKTGFYLSKDQIDYSNRYHKYLEERMVENQAIALDIMLAIRGKVSMMSFAFGYPAGVISGNARWKQKHFDRADIIQKILISKGINLGLHYVLENSAEKYVWKDSLAYPYYNKDKVVLREFDRNLLGL